VATREAVSAHLVALRCSSLQAHRGDPDNFPRRAVHLLATTRYRLDRRRSRRRKALAVRPTEPSVCAEFHAVCDCIVTGVAVRKRSIFAANHDTQGRAKVAGNYHGIALRSEVPGMVFAASSRVDSLDDVAAAFDFVHRRGHEYQPSYSDGQFRINAARSG
jgi:hypothetical protein